MSAHGVAGRQLGTFGPACQQAQASRSLFASPTVDQNDVKRSEYVAPLTEFGEAIYKYGVRKECGAAACGGGSPVGRQSAGAVRDRSSRSVRFDVRAIHAARLAIRARQPGTGTLGYPLLPGPHPTIVSLPNSVGIDRSSDLQAGCGGHAE